MFFGLLVLITALSISAVAIYYSVAGLVAIFAAAALPIMVMGGALEIGKLVTAVWLHRYWKQATWWLKTYLTLAVFVLMLITSMGIFGFLSKAHIEQTSASQESVAQVERLTTEIGRQQGIIARADERIRQLESTGTGSDANVQAQIDKEQQRIDSAYARIQPAIDEQQRIIDGQAQLYRDELARVDEALATLQGYIDAGGRENIQKAQQMVGARADGAFGPNTAQAFRNWQAQQQERRTQLLAQIQNSSNNPTAQAARREIQRLRQTAESQIADSNSLIARLRTQVGSTDRNDIDAQVDEQRAKITEANNQIDTLTEEKYALEAEYRKLEAEVGPVKYIAEFVYGQQADANLLEEAVRWVIIVIIFVFDPLAVLLLIASQYTFEFNRAKKNEVDDKERLRLNWKEYERSRAQAIVNNPGWTVEKKNDNESTDHINDEHAQPSGEDRGDSSETDNNRTGQETGLHSREDERNPTTTTIGTDDNGGDNAQGYEGLDLTPEQQERSDKLNELENELTWTEAKRAWKEQNPDQTVKFWKDLYIHGKVNNLPWEGYTQNAEQNENSLWNRIKPRDE